MKHQLPTYLEQVIVVISYYQHTVPRDKGADPQNPTDCHSFVLPLLITGIK